MPDKYEEETRFARRDGQTDEEYVHENFWAKLKRHAAKIPFAEDLVAMYYVAIDPKTPKWAKAVAFGGLAYFILPIDLIPDPLVIAGWTDDAAILAGAIKSLASRIKPEHREKAEAWLKGREVVTEDGQTS